MNKNTEKKAYVAPQMTVLQMNTTCQLLQGSPTVVNEVYYQRAIIQDGKTTYDGSTDFN